ncbi:class I histocompatibility antigen, F10 alpha chain isoform X1 [Xenopus laevis]|uniref:Class I histocompatibility antigen, F10 alpha chain isoform X1 n=1 Tax=Xenopus laevis TaxID=8355 RepID=A0A8J0TL10_XENLA|nr:class I histocompatibility antigen, F10 alpha chain isoform X1 [Xenopus laevis]
MALISFLVIFLQAGAVFSGSHSYRYFYTGNSEGGEGQPHFTATAYLDDFPIGIYTSATKTFQLRTKWIEEKADPALWKNYTNIFQGWEVEFRRGVKKMMEHFNQTEGFHSLQWMYGCELDDDGGIRAYDLDGYDGREFMALDFKKVIHISSRPETEVIAQKWNTETIEAEKMKNYLEVQCIETLKKYISYGKEHLDRKVAPKVKVFHQQSAGVIKLHCQAYGFYPQSIKVKWFRRGAQKVRSFEVPLILPNTDFTYQTRVTITVPPEEMDTYFCHVDHSSLEKTHIVVWDPSQNHLLYASLGASSILLLILTFVLGLKLGRRRQGNRTSTYSLTPVTDGDQPPPSPSV